MKKMMALVLGGWMLAGGMAWSAEVERGIETPVLAHHGGSAHHGRGKHHTGTSHVEGCGGNHTGVCARVTR